MVEHCSIEFLGHAAQHFCNFAILPTYTDYVNQHFPGSVIVFDGYEDVSTKDMTHRRRSKGKKTAQGQ